MAERPARASEPYFPEGSMLRRAQSDRMVGLLYGMRAVYIGAAHPVAFIGTYQHTAEILSPVGRLTDTARLFEDVALGDRRRADRALRITAAKHRKVRGVTGERAGTWSADTRYSAYDPELMRWTWAVLADSSIVLYEALVRRLRPGERESLYQDWVRWGELFRMPRRVAPPTHAAFLDWWREELASPERHLTPNARATAESVCFHPPVPAPARPGWGMVELLIKGSTPAPIRDLYGVRWTPAGEAAYQATTAAIRTGRRTPLLRTGQLAQVWRFLAAYERFQVARGRQTIRGLQDQPSTAHELTA